MTIQDQDHVVLGGLLHDIGKFWERGELLGEYRRDADQTQQDCPVAKDGGYRSHLHVTHTRRFCELLIEHVPILAPSTSEARDADQNWINLAVRHHVASTPLERLVQAADHFASAEREKGDFYLKRIHQKTRLESLLGRVSLQGSRHNDNYLPIAELALDPDWIFPRFAESFAPPMTWEVDEKGRKGRLSPDLLKDDYRQVGEKFLKDIREFPRFNRLSPAAIRSSLRTLLSLMERYLSQVPAATNVLHPDISLFDHLRVTAAIAESLFLFHQHEGSLDVPDRFSEEDQPKWRLVCGDFSGIQSFIYKITSKGAAKALRGRSFYIQLLCDAVAEQLLASLGLHSTARIYSSGGKFFLLIPAHLEAPIRREAANINAELLCEFQGEVFLGLGIAEVEGRHFRAGNMGAKWKEAAESLQVDRGQSFRPQLAERPAFFDAIELHKKSCAVCSRDDEEADIQPDGARQICGQCRTLERIGARLKESEYLFWVFGEFRDDAKRRLNGQAVVRLALPGTAFDVYLLSESPEVGELARMEGAHLERLNGFCEPDRNSQGYSCGHRMVGKWDLRKKSKEWEFDEFAKAGEGIERLGVLRMDVDNLGEVFIRALTFGDKEMGSLSRVATLSRQLHLFFAGYLGEHLYRAGFERTQIIYAGGDDLFLIGSWDELPDVADSIRQQFRLYCADNDQFSLSGGIAVVDGGYPISRAAQLAGDAEHAAKALRRGKRDELQKNALCFLDTPIGWEDFSTADAIRREVCELVEDMDGNRAIIGRLRAVVEASEAFQRLSKNANLEQSQIQELVHWQKWRWRLVYNIERMGRRHPAAIKERLQSLVERILKSHSDTSQPVLNWLQLPTRWAEFLTRRQ